MSRPDRPTLDELAIQFGTDKGSQLNGRTALDYCNQHYDTMMSPFRHQPIKLLEIGIKHGSSLRMWLSYFSQGQVYGIDINPASMIEGCDRITTFCGPQQDKEFLKRIVEDHAPFDFVIDDGGHWAEHQLASLESLFPHVTKAYVIEDVWNHPAQGGDALMQALCPEICSTAHNQSPKWRSVEICRHFVAFSK